MRRLGHPLGVICRNYAAKNFSLKNKKDKNWNAWNRCRMENLTLTQYISKYHEISLKLKGLNDFQCVRGFIRGLNNKYKVKIKTQYPKMLEEAIKSAQIFDDTLEKSHAARFPSARTNVTTPTSKFNNNANKRKKLGEGTNDTKKQKVCKGKLTSEDMARA